MKLKTNTKIIIASIAVLLVAVAACSFLGSISDGFTNWEDATLVERNSANLLTGKFTDFNDGNGVNATARKDGSIILSGKNLTDADLVIPVETLNLAAGTYTLSGAPKGSNLSYHIVAKYTDGSDAVQTAISDFSNKTFTIVGQQNVEISIVVTAKTSVNNVLLRPVLVSGNEIGDFYA